MTEPRTTGRLRLRVVALAVAGAAAATGAVVTAAPAQALIITCDSTAPIPVCSITIDRLHLLPPRECMCELLLNGSYADRVVLPRVGDLVNEGVYNYRSAARTTDPAVRARLERAGSDLFTQAVRQIGVKLSLKPQPQPWVTAAGTDLVTGLDALFQAERTRDPALKAALTARATAAFQSFGAR